jgi:hypothetical protein
MLTLLLQPALAQQYAPKAGGSGDPLRHEIGVRYRFLNAPENIASWWLHGPEDNPDLPERPHIAATGVGLDYHIQKGVNGGVFYVEWLKVLVTEGYFDDREEPPDYYDGDYLVPERFGGFNIGANYMAHFRVVETEGFALEPVFGIGLGVAILTGEVPKWEGHTDADGYLEIPPVLPLIDVVFGLRFLIQDHYAIRLEGGIHTLPYLGATLGYQI